MNQIQIFILIALASSCMGFVNLRGGNPDTTFKNQCEVSCLSQLDRVLPGYILGYTSITNGVKLENEFHLNMVNLCCSQQKTYDFLNGYIVPDFASVVQTNLTDINEITAKVTLANITEDQERKYEINLQQIFQRRGLALSVEASQIRVNMTTILTEMPNANECVKMNEDIFQMGWFTVVHSLGETVFFNNTIGTFQNLTAKIFTNTLYTDEEVVNIYQQFILTNSLESLAYAFEDADVYSIGTQTQGGVSLLNCENWEDYLSKIGPETYVFGLNAANSDTELAFETIKSYHLFDEESSVIKSCAYKVWEEYYHSTITEQM